MSDGSQYEKTADGHKTFTSADGQVKLIP
jgi:hypothetical protein